MRSRLNKRRTRRKSSVKSFKSGNLSPLLKLLGVVFGALAALALLAFGIMFVLEAFFKIDTPLSSSGLLGKLAGRINTPLIETPSPAPTAEPTPTPHPMADFDPVSAQHELILPGELNFPWLADPYYHGGKVICSAGRLVDGRVKHDKLIECDITSALHTGAVRELDIKPVCDHLLFPVFNEKWLVYFDANYSFGGGEIRYIDLSKAPYAPRTVKTVYVGQPEIKLDGDIIAWIERTGSEREKIFLCDLSTEETAVVEYFDNQSSGTSMPYLHDGRLVWASSASIGDSSVKSLDIATGSVSEFRPGMLVHDPEYNGQYYAWLDSPHGENARLYISDGVSGSAQIAEGAVEFRLDEQSVVYSKDEALYMYMLSTGETYRLTAQNEAAQLLGVSGNSFVFWMDVTSRERDIIKFMALPLSEAHRALLAAEQEDQTEATPRADNNGN